MYEQLNIFDFLHADIPTQMKFNPIEEYALFGTGFYNGKKRVIKFFESNGDLTDRANFLKNEYGIGGFSGPCDEPFVVYGGSSKASGRHIINYYDENMKGVEIKVTNSELAKVIEKLINENRYIQTDD